MKKRGIFKCFLFEKPTALSCPSQSRKLDLMTALCEGGAALGFDDFSEASWLFFQRHRSHFGSERFNVHRPYSHQSLGLRVGFGTVIGECPFSVFHMASSWALDTIYLSTNKQRHPLKEQPLTSGLRRSSAALKRPDRINIWHTSQRLCDGNKGEAAAVSPSEAPPAD